jgi:hypothetical protein
LSLKLSHSSASHAELLEEEEEALEKGAILRRRDDLGGLCGRRRGRSGDIARDPAAHGRMDLNAILMMKKCH